MRIMILSPSQTCVEHVVHGAAAAGVFGALARNVCSILPQLWHSSTTRDSVELAAGAGKLVYLALSL